ncbi:MAG: TauD/TfdA family dioxygenase [Myxococcota bacterium]
MPFDIRPVTAALGAEIHGIHLASLDDAGLAELRKLWMDYKVLFFRDQDLTIEEHIAFGRRFGELERHPFAPDLPEHPEIVHIASTEERPYAANMWHSDVTWRKAPSLGSILRGRVIPTVGGDTCFANAVMAYERLSPAWKERIEGVTAAHDYMKVFGRGVPDEKKAAMRETYPVQHHPVVRTHPETGEKAIYTNGSFVTHVDDVDPEESRAILDHLERAIMSPNVQCRFRWEKDSIAMWDNRCTQHFATNDFWPEERRMERVTIVGDEPR